MKQYSFHFEIKDVLTQFIAAFDDTVIKRFNKDREPIDHISVRYVYSPKQRVMYDIINRAQNITLPVVAFWIIGIKRDASRIFNKIEGVHYFNGNTRQVVHVPQPIPVDIQVGMSILARYQHDMDQLISNFAVYTNPYIVISWKIPKEFNLPQLQEIRSIVNWDSDGVTLTYPVEQQGNQKSLIVGDATFTIKSWLFRSSPKEDGAPIYVVNQSFTPITIFNNTYELSKNDQTEYFSLSAWPQIDKAFYVTGNNLTYIDSYIDLSTHPNNKIVLMGKMMDYTEKVVLVSPDPTENTEVYDTAMGPLSGTFLPFQIDNTYAISVSLSALDGFKLYCANEAGYTFFEMPSSSP